MPRFAPTGRRPTAGLPTGLPRSVGGLGLPTAPMRVQGLPGTGGGLPGTPPAPRRQVRSPAQTRVINALLSSLNSDNPHAALAHALRDPQEYNLALHTMDRIQNQQVDRQQAIAQLSTTLQAGGRIDRPDPTTEADPVQLSQKYGLSGEEATTLHELLQSPQGPKGPALLGNLAWKAMGAIPAAEAGYTKGMIEYYQDHSTHNIAPWSYIASGIGHGFVEVPGAVKEGYSWEQLLAEKNNPNSFLYRYSTPIGIGMDFLADPTVYLSGGMTAETHLLSAEAIFAKHEQAVAKATKLIEEGKAVNANGAKYTMHDLDTVVGQVKVEQGDPWSLGDGIRLRNAAKWVRQQQLEVRRAARRGEFGRKRQAGAIIAPGRVAGGAGVRFAGMELPGTARLGAYGASKARAFQAARFERAGGQEGSSLAAQLVPDSALRHTVSDLDRSIAIGARMSQQRLINSGPLVFEGNIERLLTSKLYKEQPREEIIPGKPSTTGPETGTVFSHTGTPSHHGTLPPGDEFHNLYDEHNNLIGSLTWGQSPYGGGIEAHTAYIRPDFRNVRNYLKLFEPLMEEARQGTHIQTFVLNHQLGDLIRRKAEREGLHIDVHYIHSDFSQAAAAEETARTGRVRKRGRQVPVEVPKHNLPELATPDEVRQWSDMEVMGTVDKVAPYEVRENVHHQSMSKLKTEPQRKFRELYDKRVNGFRRKALEQGWDRAKVEDLIRYYGDENADPVEALAKMQTHLEINTLSKNWIKDVLGNPVFARKLDKTRVNDRGTIIYRADPPAGFSYFRYNNKDYAVKTPVAYALEAMRNDAFLQYMHNQGPYAFTNIQDWWKIMATMPNPSFHTMNFLGAVWNNQLAGMYNPADYIKTYYNYLHKSRLERSARLGRPTLRAPIKALRGQAPESTAEGAHALSVVRELERRGGGGRSSYIFGETEAALGDPSLALLGPRRMVDRLTKPSSELRAKYAKTPPQLGDVEKNMPRPKVNLRTANRALAARRTRQALAIGLTPFTGGTSAIGLLPEVSRFARTHVGGPIENLVRMTPFVTKAHDPQLLHTLRQLDDSFGPPRAIGYDLENFSPHVREQAYDIAAALVRRYQFDYSDLTDFERRFVKSFFPFYTYYRKNFVVQAQEIVKRPRNFQAAQALMNYSEEQAGDLGPDLEAILPTYFDNLMAFQLPVPGSVRRALGLPEKEPIFVNPKLPFVSLNLFPPLWGLANQDGLTPQSMGNILAPIMGSVGPHALGIPGSKIAVEYITGWEFGLNRPIDYQRASSNDWRNGTQDAPFYAKFLPKPIQKWMHIVKDKRGRLVMTASNRYILDQMATPFMTNWGSSIMPGAASDLEAEKVRANRVAWLTGVRLIPADMHKLSKNQAYATKNMLEARQSDLRSRGLDLSDQDANELDIARDLVDIAKEVDDQRYFELYGEERSGP